MKATQDLSEFLANVEKRIGPSGLGLIRSDEERGYFANIISNPNPFLAAVYPDLADVGQKTYPAYGATPREAVMKSFVNWALDDN